MLQEDAKHCLSCPDSSGPFGSTIEMSRDDAKEPPLWTGREDEEQIEYPRMDLDG